MSDTIVQNQRPCGLTIKGSNGNSLVLAPLEERKIPSEKLEPFDLRPLEQQNYIRTEKEERGQKRLEWMGPVIMLAVIGSFVGGSALEQAPIKPALLTGYWIVTPVLILIGIVIAIVFSLKHSTVVLRTFWQSISLAAILVIGVGVPFSAMYFFDGGINLVNGNPSVDLLGRGLLLVFIVTASLLPALLYFLFDRLTMATLRDRLYRDIFRLDPQMTTLTDVDARFGKQIDEVYGERGPAGSSRLVSGSRWPIIVTTLVVTLGWIMTLLPAKGASGDGTQDQILQLFTPAKSMVVFAFLGAYFFSINMILRRYARGDLKPKAYSQIAVRVYVVVILAWVLELVFASEGGLIGAAANVAGNAETTGLILAFFVGIVPETALKFIQDYFRGKKLGKLAPQLQEKLPLTQLDGVDLYDRARLLDEGITNIEGLAHHELIDLLIETRIPAPRIVDWVDQAILYLHVPITEKQNAEGRSLIDTLRSYGVRTATDLQAVCNAAAKRGKQDLCQLLAILDDPSTGAQAPVNERTANSARGNGTAKPSRVQVILDALADDEWLNCVDHWRKNEIPVLETIDVPAKIEAAVPSPPQSKVTP
ncbi:MAG: hypothetical protein V3T53_06940 [Phycisphaerales bacterium]